MEVFHSASHPTTIAQPLSAMLGGGVLVMWRQLVKGIKASFAF
jgi:hypothetical protein